MFFDNKFPAFADRSWITDPTRSSVLVQDQEPFAVAANLGVDSGLDKRELSHPHNPKSDSALAPGHHF
jgi:hypothetical protein